ncbi:MAG: hypothetical protein ACP59X_14335 [Solidesulfovibrio sp. DCME]|uniref:hypothetical protein n=1 Tax=Solidesulfovibrio sp. DCME TaxID=3447380 RepID=UPI003D12075C
MATYPSTSAGLLFISATSFSIPGDQTAVYKPRRQLRVTQGGTVYNDIYVVSSVYSGGITTVTTYGAALLNTMTLVQLGQDPDNAPREVVPTGGSAGQYLAKTSSADYAVQWVTPLSAWTFEFYG